MKNQVEAVLVTESNKSPEKIAADLYAHDPKLALAIAEAIFFEDMEARSR